MRFIAHYSPIQRDSGLKDYYRTIDADTLPEADKIGRMYERKSYRLSTLTQTLQE